MRDREVLELEQQWKMDKRWAGVLRPYSAEDVVGLRLGERSSTRWPGWGRSAPQPAADGAVRPGLGRQTGPGRAAGAGRAEGGLRQRLAGRRRHEHRRPTYPTKASTRPTASPTWSAASTMPSNAPRNRAQRGDRRANAAMVRAHRGRRRGRLRRRAQRLRADEVHD